MGRKLLWGIVFLALVACSRQADTPQRELVRRLGDADRVIFINPSNDRASLVLSNKHVKRIVRALKTSQQIPPNILAAKGYALVFFRGTNRLATLPTSQIIFWIDGKPYEDKSETLEAAYGQAVSEEHRSGLAP